MIESINAGFGEPLSVEHDIQDIQRMRLTGVRTDIPPDARPELIEAILKPFVNSGLRVLALLHSENLSWSDRHYAEQGVNVVMTGRAVGIPEGFLDVEAANEPDLSDILPRHMSTRLVAIYRALQNIQFEGLVLGGSVSNTVDRGFMYLADMAWETLPREIQVAIHRYAPRNKPGASHMASFQHEIVHVMDVTKRHTPPAITEFGHHTARQTSEWSWKHGYQPEFRLTNEEAAEAILTMILQGRQWGIPRMDVFQLNCGVPKSDTDYEALYGVRAPDGRWLSQADTLAIR